ncbi:hypothetical protein KA107_00480 [Candidatus Pacearchaeota archaeon]|nr:hypothetical protein [Candidatus Pacearchaeota archaeon]
MTNEATEQQRRDLVEGLPTKLLCLEVGTSSQRSKITGINGYSLDKISNLYLGGTLLDAIQAIIEDPNSRGRKYEIIIQGETK